MTFLFIFENTLATSLVASVNAYSSKDKNQIQSVDFNVISFITKAFCNMACGT